MLYTEWSERETVHKQGPPFVVPVAVPRTVRINESFPGPPPGAGVIPTALCAPSRLISFPIYLPTPGPRSLLILYKRCLTKNV